MTNNPELIRQFIKLVTDMRIRQRAFFSDRNQFTLTAVKAAEKQVDGWLNHFAETGTIVVARRSVRCDCTTLFMLE
jgi:hypothetical protein